MLSTCVTVCNCNILEGRVKQFFLSACYFDVRDIWQETHTTTSSVSNDKQGATVIVLLVLFHLQFPRTERERAKFAL